MRIPYRIDRIRHCAWLLSLAPGGGIDPLLPFPLCATRDGAKPAGGQNDRKAQSRAARRPASSADPRAPSLALTAERVGLETQGELGTGGRSEGRSSRPLAAMEYLGDKLSVAHSQVSGWVGSVRRSLQGALSLVSSGAERGGGAEDGGGGGAFKRAASLRSLASRSRESFRRFSLRSQQRLSLRRRPADPGTPTSEQLKQCVSAEEEGRDTDTLVHETDSQYGTWDTGLRTDDSLTPATPTSDSNLSSSPRKPTPPHTPGEPTTPSDLDTPDAPSPAPQTETEPLPFPETSTTLLDSSALRSRVQLSKKRSRRNLPSRAARHSAGLSVLQEGPGAAADDWMYRDSTEEKVESSKQEDSDTEEQPRGAETRPAASQPQRVALFPGMDPSALKAQLKKRGDSDNQTEGASPSATQLSRSPKSPFLPRASRVLPPAGGKENGEESSPQWLKELKSKKRLSQYDNDT
ncbi:hypothetical protein MATL_G00057860 [Megalops atlanticus]|uniref:Tankyrase 1-binding protein C-terminal domain-containing protein n=1 Tax=Megalops atlanticus TaxID=7932 RepID=A0A9D3QC05_MEGAT|nr:hypothetical protein MATL_G00057860 [Megalops atlanticus]